MDSRPFGTIRRSIANDFDLTQGEFAVYAALCIFANKRRTCFPSIAAIMGESGIKKADTVRRHLRALEKKGLLQTIAKHGKANVYKLNDSE